MTERGTVRERVRLRGLLLRPDTCFLVLAIPIGLAYLLLTPPMRVPDEANHFLRALQLVQTGAESGTMPVSLLAFSAQATRKARLMRRGDAPPFSVADLRTLAARPLDAANREPYAGNRAAGYSAVPYLPALPPLAAGLALGFSPFALLVVARAALFLGGVALLYLAIRLAPVLRWTLVLLALTPTAAFLRSGFSADTVTTGLAFLLFALLVRRTTSAPSSAAPGVLAVMVVAIGVGLAKTAYLPLALATLCLLAVRPASGVARVGVWLAIAAPWVAGLWWIAAVTGPELTGAALAGTDRASPGEQLALVTRSPGVFVGAALRTWLDPAAMLLFAEGLIGRLGLLDRSLPATLLVPFALGLLVTPLVRSDVEPECPAWMRALCGIAALGCILALSLAAYLEWTPPGSPIVHGLQGRYLAPIAPFLLLAVTAPARLRVRVPEPWLASFTVVASLAGNLAGIGSIAARDWQWA